jgi:hypothetical protein
LPFLPLLSAAIAALTAGVALLLRARRTRARQLTAG